MLLFLLLGVAAVAVVASSKPAAASAPMDASKDTNTTASSASDSGSTTNTTASIDDSAGSGSANSGAVYSVDDSDSGTTNTTASVTDGDSATNATTYAIDGSGRSSEGSTSAAVTMSSGYGFSEGVEAPQSVTYSQTLKESAAPAPTFTQSPFLGGMVSGRARPRR